MVKQSSTAQQLFTIEMNQKQIDFIIAALQAHNAASNNDDQINLLPAMFKDVQAGIINGFTS